MTTPIINITNKSCREANYFNVGQVIELLTIHDDKLVGEVLAFDLCTNVIMLKSYSNELQSNAHEKTFPVRLVNLSLVRNVTILKEAPADGSEADDISKLTIHFDKLNKRHADAVERKKRSVAPKNVSKEGQKLFMTLIKTIDDVEWMADEIVILGSVVISPPYSRDSVQTMSCRRRRLEKQSREPPSSESPDPPTPGHQTQMTMQHVKKIVDKFCRDYELQEPPRNMNSSYSEGVRAELAGSTQSLSSSRDCEEEFSKPPTSPLSISTSNSTAGPGSNGAVNNSNSSSANIAISSTAKSSSSRTAPDPDGSLRAGSGVYFTPPSSGGSFEDPQEMTFSGEQFFDSLVQETSTTVSPDGNVVVFEEQREESYILTLPQKTNGGDKHPPPSCGNGSSAKSKVPLTNADESVLLKDT